MKKSYVLFDSNAERSYDDYIEFCEMNDIEPQGEEMECLQSMDYDDFITNIKHCVYNRQKWAVEGTLGLWNGRKDIVPKVFDNLLEAISACIGSCDYVKIIKNYSKIEVEASHHDGTNRFTLRCLSDLGEIRWNNNGQVSLKNKENLMTLPQWLF